MNQISRLANVARCLRIGKNNIIHKNVTIHPQVTIGNNNKIYDGTVIYPNTSIGDNNIILNDNILGEYGVSSGDDAATFKEKTYSGLHIGNRNFFHVRNIVFSGEDTFTTIGNDNQILVENHVGHDTTITDNVILYPRCITGGYSTLLPFSTMGFYSTIQQRKVLGGFAMLGAGTNCSHNVFPYYIYIPGKYLRLNMHRIPIDMNIEGHSRDVENILNLWRRNYASMNDIENNDTFGCIKSDIDRLPRVIAEPIQTFINHIPDLKI